MAWAGAALFAASLLYFLFSYVVTFGEITSGPVHLAAVATNVTLFSVFALHHSLFARERVRAWMARTVPAALERSVYVWVASLMLVAVCLLWQPVAGVAWQVTGPAVWLLYVVQIAGGWLTLRSATAIDVWDLAGVRQTQGRPEGRPESMAFKTDGPYGWVRHPIYLGWFLLVLPVATMTMTRLLFAVVSCAYLVLAIPLEERSLRRTAGAAYDDYMRKVRWKLLPYLH